jgi:hypothetical protein
MKPDETKPRDRDDAMPELSPGELEAEMAIELPERHAMSVAFPLGAAITPSVASRGAAAVAEAVQDADIEQNT